METKTTKSAGAVILSEKGTVVVVSQRGDSWSLPKGHIDPGEDALGAAIREAREESGLADLVYVRELGMYERHKIGNGGSGEDLSERKHITIFLCRANETALTPEDPHNPEARWVPIADVAAMLTHPKDAAFFTSIQDQLLQETHE